MTTRPELWSEATEELDFGEGTKVRIRNRTVTLKGKFYRDDSARLNHYKRELSFHQAASEAIGAAIKEANPEKYPNDAGAPITARIANLGKKIAFERSEKEKLLLMVSDRDTTIRNLKLDFIDLRNKLIATGKDHFFGLISALAENRHTK